MSACEEIREWEKQCMICRRLKAKMAQLVMTVQNDYLKIADFIIISNTPPKCGVYGGLNFYFIPLVDCTSTLGYLHTYQLT